LAGHHVLALQGSPEGWQTTSLLERCREHAGRQGRVVQRHVLYLGEINKEPTRHSSAAPYAAEPIRLSVRVRWAGGGFRHEQN